MFLTMFLHIPTLGVLLLVTAGKVTCVDDFDFICPHTWKNGTVETLVCTIPVNKFSSSAPCGIYADSVVFKYTKQGYPSSDCSVVNIDTICNNSINQKGCGCQEKNATHVSVFFNVSATRNLHENAEWNCEPQCLTSLGDQMLSARNSSACFRTAFETTTTITSTTTESVPPTSSTSSPGEDPTEDGGLTPEEKAGIGAGVGVPAVGIAGGAVAYIVIKMTIILVYFTIAKEHVPALEKKIKDMRGVSIRPINPEEQEKYKECNYVIEISKLSKDQKQIRTELTAIIEKLGGRINSDELRAIEVAAECIADSPDRRNEPPVDYPAGAQKAQTQYNGNGNGQPKKRKSDKEIPLSIVGSSPPPSETSADEKTHMIPPTKGRALPVPANQHDPTSTGIGKSASPRLDPLTQDHSKMTSVERNSGAFPRKLPSPGQPPLDPIPSGKKS